MKYSFRHVLALLWAVSTLTAAEHYSVADPFMAEYEGFWTAANGAKGRVTAQIRPLSNNQYDGFVLLTRAKSPVAGYILKNATAEKNSLKFEGAAAKESGGDLLAESETQCEVRDGKITGTFNGELGQGTFEAKKSERISPTLGVRPPKHATVLFDEAGKTEGWDNLTWSVTKDKSLQVSKGNIRAKDKLTNYRLHLEFRTPYMPTATGQGRGNSGVYLQGKYEVQVLDSFGLYPLRDNDCSGIYGVQAPAVNACLPPMQWQTYDITYFEATESRRPTITVSLNGITVIERAEVPADLVAKGSGGGDLNAGFLMLQDHGNPVQFRNIWVEPIFSAAKAR